MVTMVSEAQHKVTGMEISNLTYRRLTSRAISTRTFIPLVAIFFLTC